MKKILEKILYFIAALLALIFVLMLISMVNPTAHDFATKVVNKIAPPDKTPSPDENDDATAVVSFPEEEQTEESDEEEKDDKEGKEDKSYEEYADGWSQDGLDDEVVNDDTYDSFFEDFVKGFVKGLTREDYTYDDEDDFRKAFENSAESRSDYEIPEPVIVVVEDETEAEEVVKDTTVGETGDELEFDPLFYPYYNILNSKCKRLYKQIYANAIALNESFLPVEEATTKEWNNAMFSVVYDHPELFWIDISIYKQYDWAGNVIKLSFEYYDEFNDVPAARERFEAKAEELISGAKGLGSDYEKEKYIHDLIEDKLTYVHNDLDQSAYSAIVYDETVCAGYSKAFQYLMQKLEVPTYTCVGWGGYGILFGGMHGWNIIKLDSDFYNVDCTWDDQDPTVYDYFNLSDDENDGHTRMMNSVYLPPCNGSKYSGVVKLGLSDFGFSASDVISDIDAYYAKCKELMKENYTRDGNGFECTFYIPVTKDLLERIRQGYEYDEHEDAYLKEAAFEINEENGMTSKYISYVAHGQYVETSEDCYVTKQFYSWE